MKKQKTKKPSFFKKHTFWIITTMMTAAIVLIGGAAAIYMYNKEFDAYNSKKNQVTAPSVQIQPKSNTTPKQNETNNTPQSTSGAAPNTGSSNSTQPTKSNTSIGSYVASVCKYETIPAKVEYVDADWMYIGETKTHQGVDGWIYTCTADSNGYTPPPRKFEGGTTTVYKGTKQKPQSSGYSYEDALRTAQGQCSTIAQGSGTGSSAYQICISTVLANYGY